MRSGGDGGGGGGGGGEGSAEVLSMGRFPAIQHMQVSKSAAPGVAVALGLCGAAESSGCAPELAREQAGST